MHDVSIFPLVLLFCLICVGSSQSCFQVSRLVALIHLPISIHGWSLGMNQVSLLELIGLLVLRVIRLHFGWKFFVILKEPMPAHPEVLGSTILVTGEWYGSSIYLCFWKIMHTEPIIFFLELAWYLSILWNADYFLPCLVWYVSLIFRTLKKGRFIRWACILGHQMRCPWPSHWQVLMVDKNSLLIPSRNVLCC